MYVSNNSYTVMGGQHRWAPAFLAACHHIYFITYYCILILIWLIKLLLFYNSFFNEFFEIRLNAGAEIGRIKRNIFRLVYSLEVCGKWTTYRKKLLEFLYRYRMCRCPDNSAASEYPVWLVTPLLAILCRIYSKHIWLNREKKLHFHDNYPMIFLKLLHL